MSPGLEPNFGRDYGSVTVIVFTALAWRLHLSRTSVLSNNMNDLLKSLKPLTHRILLLLVQVVLFSAPSWILNPAIWEGGGCQDSR
jgi:hypothetical protein